mmetsp:Transcript_89434/g.148650  ORF Transcript_89434/g.148650 Transcript_89434/m.148650 type:complete len:217 (-) Transcript_89434:653-1303(-)
MTSICMGRWSLLRYGSGKLPTGSNVALVQAGSSWKARANAVPVGRRRHLSAEVRNENAFARISNDELNAPLSFLLPSRAASFCKALPPRWTLPLARRLDPGGNGPYFQWAPSRAGVAASPSFSLAFGSLAAALVSAGFASFFFLSFSFADAFVLPFSFSFFAGGSLPFPFWPSSLPALPFLSSCPFFLPLLSSLSALRPPFFSSGAWFFPPPRGAS